MNATNTSNSSDDAARADGAATDTHPFRYTGELAQGIEARWQGRWAAEGTFNTPNPVGPLAIITGNRIQVGIDMKNEIN